LERRYEIGADGGELRDQLSQKGARREDVAVLEVSTVPDMLAALSWPSSITAGKCGPVLKVHRE
jgi:hypothetical protein